MIRHLYFPWDNEESLRLLGAFLLECIFFLCLCYVLYVVPGDVLSVYYLSLLAEGKHDPERVGTEALNFVDLGRCVPMVCLDKPLTRKKTSYMIDDRQHLRIRIGWASLSSIPPFPLPSPLLKAIKKSMSPQDSSHPPPPPVSSWSASLMEPPIGGIFTSLEACPHPQISSLPPVDRHTSNETFSKSEEVCSNPQAFCFHLDFIESEKLTKLSDCNVPGKNKQTKKLMWGT